MSLLRNSTIVVLGVVISNILAYIFHIYVGRALGPAEYGVFGALLSLLMLVALPAGAISLAITKFVAKFNFFKSFSKIESLRKKVTVSALIYSVILLLILSVLSPIIADFLNIESKLSIAIVGFSLIFAVISPINRGVLQGMKKFKVYSYNSILESVTRLVLAFILIYFGFGADGAVLSYGLAYLVAFLAIFPYIKETRTDKKEKIDLGPVYRFILIVLVVNLTIQGIINVPTVLIKHYFSSEFTGLWTAALTLARITLFVASGISLVMFSEVSGIADRKKQESLFRRAMFLTLLASVGISAIFWLIPSLFVSVLYGSGYMGASVILSWMSVAMILLAVLQLWANYWLARRGS